MTTTIKAHSVNFNHLGLHVAAIPGDPSPQWRVYEGDSYVPLDPHDYLPIDDVREVDEGIARALQDASLDERTEALAIQMMNVMADRRTGAESTL